MSKRIILLQALAASLSHLKLLLQGIDDNVFSHRATSQDWSVADVLNHLVMVEAQYLHRLQRVLAEERPFLPAIFPDESSHNRHVSLAEFAAARQKTLAFLQDVADEGWGRTAVHETQGEVTLQFLVQYLVDHDSQHLNQIAMIQQQLNAAPDRKAQPAISER